MKVVTCHFPNLPKGYKWDVQYYVGNYGNANLRVRILRWGWWQRHQVWRDFQEDVEPFNPYTPTPDQIYDKGVEYALICWARFTKTGAGDARLQAALDLMSDLNSGTLP